MFMLDIKLQIGLNSYLLYILSFDGRLIKSIYHTCAFKYSSCNQQTRLKIQWKPLSLHEAREASLHVH